MSKDYYKGIRNKISGEKKGGNLFANNLLTPNKPIQGLRRGNSIVTGISAEIGEWGPDANSLQLQLKS